MNISFFNLRFDFFSIIDQVRNNVVCVVARHCFRILLCTHYDPLKCFSTYFRKLKEIGVLRPIFPDVISDVISCDYDLILYFFISHVKRKLNIIEHTSDVNLRKAKFLLDNRTLL